MSRLTSQKYIYVISASEQPLMPTTRQGHVRRLLNAGKARITSHVPFVIQLKYYPGYGIQSLHGGTDPGRMNIGEAVLNNKGEVVFKAHVTTRNRHYVQRPDGTHPSGMRQTCKVKGYHQHGSQIQ